MAKVSYFVCDVCGNKIDKKMKPHGGFKLECGYPLECRSKIYDYELCDECLNKVVEFVADFVCESVKE
jgi:hypothetical protein